MSESTQKIAIPSDDEVARFAVPSQDVSAPAPNGEDEATALRRDLADAKDKLLRAQAECANISKRLHQQHIEDRKFAVMSLARSMLGVVDNIDRTLESLADRPADDPVVSGIRLIAEQLSKVLKENGVEPIAALGQPFDPTRHEALMQDRHSAQPAGTITQELQRGYLLHDRVLRPARVAIATGGSDEAGGSATS